MRRPYFIFSIFTLLLLTLPLLTTLPAFSEESALATPPAAQATPATGTLTSATPHYEKSTPKSPAPKSSPKSPAPNSPPKPQIITDEKNNVVRVLIGGKEVLTIDAKGLHVHGNLDYSGIITDTKGASP